MIYNMAIRAHEATAEFSSMLRFINIVLPSVIRSGSPGAVVAYFTRCRFLLSRIEIISRLITVQGSCEKEVWRVSGQCITYKWAKNFSIRRIVLKGDKRLFRPAISTSCLHHPRTKPYIEYIDIRISNFRSA